MMDWQSLEVKVTQATETPCDCCRAVTTDATGDLYKGNEFLAWYSARWSDGHPDVPMIITIYCGDWREGASSDQRWGTQAEVRFGRDGGCVLVDWSEKAKAKITLFTPLGRDDVLQTSYAPEFWSCIDAVLMKDPRLEHFLG